MMDLNAIERLYFKLQKKELWDKTQILKDIDDFKKCTEKILELDKSPTWRYNFAVFFAKIIVFGERIVCKHSLDKIINVEQQKELDQLLALVTSPKELTWQEKFELKKKDLIK